MSKNYQKIVLTWNTICVQVKRTRPCWRSLGRQTMHIDSRLCSLTRIILGQLFQTLNPREGGGGHCLLEFVKRNRNNQCSIERGGDPIRQAGFGDTVLCVAKTRGYHSGLVGQPYIQTKAEMTSFRLNIGFTG